MSQVQRLALTTAVWGVAWTAMLWGTAYHSIVLLVWGIFIAMAGVVLMVWFIVEYAMAAVTDLVVDNLTQRDQRRTTEMAEASARVSGGGGDLRIVPSLPDDQQFRD